MSESVLLNVTGMKCGGCEAHVTSALGKLDGVLSATASSKEQNVHVEYESGKTDLAAIRQTITDAGYTVVSA